MPKADPGQSSEHAAAPSGRFKLIFTLPGHGGRREGIVKDLWRSANGAGAQEMGNASWTALNFPNELKIDDDFYEALTTSANNSKFKVLKAGTYRFEYTISARCADNTNDCCIHIYAKKTSGSTTTNITSSDSFIHSANNTGAPSARRHSVTRSFIVTLAADDYVEIGCEDEGSFTGSMKAVTDETTVMVELKSYSAEDNLGGRQVAGRAGQIVSCWITRGAVGDTGTTEIDILKNGSSILGSGNLQLTPSDTLKTFSEAVFNDTEVLPNDIFTVDVSSEEDPYPRETVIVLACAGR